MVRHGIPVDDLNQLTDSFEPATFAMPADVHYSGAGNAALACQVAAAISVPPGSCGAPVDRANSLIFAFPWAAGWPSVAVVSVPVQTMLVASPRRWDEACFAVPAVRALAAGGIAVTVVCRPEQQAFWQSLAGIAVVAVPAKVRAITALLVGKADAILLWEADEIAKAAKKARIERRLGPTGGKLTKFLSDPVEAAPGPLDHRVQFYLNVLSAMGVGTARPEFFAPAEFAAPRIGRSVLLAPDSDFGPSHEWVLERWQHVASHLAAIGCTIGVACGAGGRQLGEALAAAVGDEMASRVTVNLSDLPLATLATWSLVIAADGSLPHLAGHCGATAITLFGPNDAHWKRPLGKRHTVVKHHVECAPCLMEKCPLDRRCQNELTVERVIAAADAQLAR